MQFIDYIKFATTALDLDKKAFIVYIVYLKVQMLIYLAEKTQIILLLIKKVIILKTYLAFANIFSKKLIAELLKRSDINKYVINLELNK